jgi:hypothetical protein
MPKASAARIPSGSETRPVLMVIRPIENGKNLYHDYQSTARVRKEYMARRDPKLSLNGDTVYHGLSTFA